MSLSSQMRTTCRILSTGMLMFQLACFGRDDTLSRGDDFNANTTAAAATLQTWYNSKGLWDSTGWWNAANCLEAIENAIQANNGQDYIQVLATTFELNSGENFLNEYYDDEGWWALAWIRAFDLTGEFRYLAMARVIFADMTGGWDDTCGGGCWWKKDRRYKNAIANELFLLVAIRLHQRTPGDHGPGSYLEWALKEWEWFRNSGMINTQNLINDGLDRNCQNNRRTTWTYNQGVILGGLVELYRVTKDTNCLNQALAIADAATSSLVYSNGILREPCEPDHCRGADVPQFKGIFVRYLANLYDLTRKPAYREFLASNARSVWINDRDAAGRLGLRWTGPFDTPDAARHSSAMMAVSALTEPATTNLLYAKGLGNSACKLAVGEPSGSLAWQCTPADVPGIVQSGLCLSDLPMGDYTIHFRMAVGALDRSKRTLARLEVVEGDSVAMLASREVHWNEFAEAGSAQDFSLVFHKSNPGRPLDFRVHWLYTPAGPSLTLTDITLGGFHNWTAANLQHEIGSLEGMNAWVADPLRDTASGFLCLGPGTRELPKGEYVARFEVKVDDFSRDDANVATLSVIESDSGKVVASKDIRRRQFSSILFHTFDVPFKAASRRRYDFRTYWHRTPDAPRLTQRAVIVRPARP